MLQPFMAQAAVIVGCSSSFKWRQEYIMAAESEVAVRRGSYCNTRSHYCGSKMAKVVMIQLLLKAFMAVATFKH